jgi:hypothetical protein
VQHGQNSVNLCELMPPGVFSLVAQRYHQIHGAKVQMAAIPERGSGRLLKDAREGGLRLRVGDTWADAGDAKPPSFRVVETARAQVQSKRRLHRNGKHHRGMRIEDQSVEIRRRDALRTLVCTWWSDVHETLSSLFAPVFASYLLGVPESPATSGTSNSAEDAPFNA